VIVQLDAISPMLPLRKESMMLKQIVCFVWKESSSLLWQLCAPIVWMASTRIKIPPESRVWHFFFLLFFPHPFSPLPSWTFIWTFIYSIKFNNTLWCLRWRLFPRSWPSYKLQLQIVWSWHFRARIALCMQWVRSWKVPRTIKSNELRL
jgi:hypothetical protein